MKATCLILGFLVVHSCNSKLDLLPTSTTNEIIKHTYYTLSYNEEYEQAEWVYYILTSEMLSGTQPRTDDFREDPEVSTGSAMLVDYFNSGYDRGHLCPAADMKINQNAMSETFYMSNISPQDPSFNRGIWNSLEAIVRSWAVLEDSINVVAGGVLTSSKGTIGPDAVTIPKYFYKIIYDPTDIEKMIGFLLPNEKDTLQLPEYIVSVDSIEKLTGIDFFPGLQDKIENRLELESDPANWVF